MSADIYGFAEFGELGQVVDQAMLVFMIFYMVMMALLLIYSVVVYVLQSLGIYSIAKRRGIHHSWLAWIPVGNVWVIGSISDQYQFVAKGKTRNRRKVLMGLYIALYALLLAFYITFFASFFRLVGMESGFRATAMIPFMGSLLISLAMLVVSIIATVFLYIAYYDLFASCNPDNAVVFLILGIFFNFLLPFFVFACRKKDAGMPPRRVQVPTAPWTPVQNPPAPVWQPPVQPAEKPIVEDHTAEAETTED